MANLPYDPTTLLGQVRFHAADTDLSPVDLPDGTQGDNANFSDAELTYCLTLGLSDPMLAAAIALESLAADRARLALIVKTEGSQTDMTKLAGEIAARASTLRTLSMLPPAVLSPDQVFSTTSGMGTVEGTMDTW